MIRKTHPPLSEHRAMLERMAYFCFLLLVIGGLGWTSLGMIIGLVTGDFRAFCVGVGAVLLARVLHPWGQKHWHFRECEASLSYRGEAAYGGEDAEHAEHAAALRTILLTLTTLREDEMDTDVWEVQRLRGEARELIAVDDALREDFEEELAAHPELLPR